MRAKNLFITIRSEAFIQLLKASIAASAITLLFTVLPGSYGPDEANAWESLEVAFTVATALLKNKVSCGFLAAAVGCMLTEHLKEFALLLE